MSTLLVKVLLLLYSSMLGFVTGMAENAAICLANLNVDSFLNGFCFYGFCFFEAKVYDEIIFDEGFSDGALQ